MRITVIFFLCFALVSMNAAQEAVKEDLPAAVVWGLGVYGGATQPLGPYDFAQFWKTGFSLSMEADILLKNDVVLGLTFGYSRSPLNTPRFFKAKELPENGEPPDDLAVGISHILLSFKGIENYMLYRYDLGYEVGLGLYNMSNTQLYIQYWGPETGYTVTEGVATAGGVFAGLSAKYLVTDTLQLSVKGRFHYVWVAPMHHQFLDILVGVTIL